MMKRQNPWRNRRPVTASGFDLETQWQFASRWFKRALKASTFLGMLIVMFYFLGLRAMPVDSLSSIGQLAAPVAFAAILFFLLLLIFWGIPTFMARALFIDGKWNKENRLPWITACISRWNKPGKAPDFWAYFLFASIWNVSTLGLWWFAIFAWAIPNHFFGDPWNKGLSGIFVALSFGCPYLWLGWLNKAAMRSQTVTTFQMKVSWHDWLSLGGLYGLMAIAPITVLLILAGISPWGSDDNSKSVWSVLIVVWMVAIFSNAAAFASMLYRESEQQKTGTLAFAIHIGIPAASLLVLVLVLSPQALMNSVMSVLSVRIPNATLQLNQAGCESVTQWGVEFDPGPPRVPAQICTISKVVVFSRVGSFWLIGCEPPRIPIDKKTQPVSATERRRWLQSSFVQGIEQQDSDKNSGHQLPSGSYCP